MKVDAYPKIKTFLCWVVSMHVFSCWFVIIYLCAFVTDFMVLGLHLKCPDNSLVINKAGLYWYICEFMSRLFSDLYP